MSTIANVRTPESAHWYQQDGTPCYELPKKDGSGMKTPTLADARKLNLLPSVTTILRILHKQALVEWLCEQAALAVLTTPKQDGEALDAFVERVLHTERQQDQEAQIARDRGTEIHNAIDAVINGAEVDSDLLPWIQPSLDALRTYGKPHATEAPVVGKGYAGRTDAVIEAPDAWWIWDWKTTKKLPDPKKGGAWSEHRLQLAAYAAAWQPKLNGKPIRTANLYISTVDCGKFVVCEHAPEWQATFEGGFKPLVMHWQWSTGYAPKQ